MKKITLILSFIFIALISLSVENAKACPPGFSGPNTTDFWYNGCCHIQVRWCCGGVGPGTILPDVSVDEVDFLNNCDCIPDALDMDGHTYKPIPWDAIMDHIVNSNFSCFVNRWSNVPPCPGTGLTVQLFNGWCYYYSRTMDDPPGGRYVMCATQPPSSQAKCVAFYNVCLETINGVPHIKTTPISPITPQFQCGPGCYSRCSQ